VITFTDIKTSLLRLIQAYTDSPFFPSADNVNGLIQNNIMDQLTDDGTGKTHIDVNFPNAGFDPKKPATAPEYWDGNASSLPNLTGTNDPYLIVTVPVNLSDPTDPVAIAIAAAKELISKLWKGEDTPLIPTWEIEWSQYYFRPVQLDGGCYVQNPVGVVPDYFIDPNQNGTSNIFANLSNINPQLFASNGIQGGPVNISWLRLPDTQNYQRTWFKVTRRWLGSPVGAWDPDLYNTFNRPQTANDYSQFI
jgi:hypothetical protein